MTDLGAALSVLESRLGGALGVYAAPLDRPDAAVRRREDESFPAASTIKVFVLQTLLEAVRHGERTLDDELPLDPDDQVTGSGVLKSLTPGRPYTLLDLATLMIVVSDNTATNLLIGALGLEAINGVCARHGWTATRLAGKLQKGLARSSFTSPRDLADHFARLWRGELLPDPLAEVARGIYRRQHYTDQLGRRLGYDPYSTETGASDLVIASKSGSIRGVRNDAGVIEAGGERYALAIMTKDCPDERFHPDNLGSLVVSDVSEALLAHFGALGGGAA